MNGAHQEYSSRLQQQQERIRGLSRIDSLLSTARGILFVIFVLLFFYIFNSRGAYLWITLPAILFAIAVVMHERIIDRKNLALRIASFYERGLARIEHRWMGQGIQGNQFQDATHPYSEDLDLFGSGSLFELLCTARTQSGEQILADWLKKKAEQNEIPERQSAVQDLRTRLHFREDLASQGTDVRNRMRPETLIHWAEKSPVPFAKGLRAATSFSVLFTFLTLYGWSQLGWGWNPFVIVTILQIVFLRHLGNRVIEITQGAEGAHQELKLLSSLLERIETENFQSRYLQHVQQEMRSEGIVPSRQIRKMGTLLELLDWQRNQLFAPIAILLLWQPHLAFALEDWRKKYGKKIHFWIRSVGEIEAISSLACYSYEHPEDPFPDVVEDACFEGTDLGHPLIPENQCVRNSIELNPGRRLKIVSGSNMSGKSTFLRTIGVNAILALAGAPVRAKQLRLSRLSIGASIHILDSLQTGSSRFYAEITRLRQIMDLAQKEPPLLFLLDEILHGTNSADRLVGADAIVRGLQRRNAMGLLTTHDLALTNIAEKLGPIAENIHFQDHIEDGRIAFDYRVHPGVVQKSNAIALMRAVGLEV
ncbi:DNA mismatch repair protein MutS [bacterium]|nr:DNA mismatch repair protein MutS [bacterium]